MSMLKRAWTEDQGVLTFEWVLLVTLLTIGVVGGISAVRDAVISELGDVAEAMVALDQSYTISVPVDARAHDESYDGASDSRFLDTMCNFADSCRPDNPPISQEIQPVP
jgi:Flp pilus assembly pilin Flp